MASLRPAMLASLLPVVLALAPQGVDAGPSAATIAATETALEAAFRSRDLKEIQAALEAAQAVPAASVVKSVARGLEDERREVKLATLQALRWNEHRDALEVLHRALKDRRWAAVQEVAVAHLRAIGQHADPSSIAVLARNPFEPDDAFCLRARLFGLARIRTREALEAVLEILGTSGAGPAERRVQAVMGDVRLALVWLTGVDQGRSPELWERWWRENRKTFRVSSEPPLLPKELRETWDGYWGLPQQYQRERRREDRGRDPERPRSP